MAKQTNLKRLYDAAVLLSSDNIKGVVVECGVWKGGSAALIARAMGKDRRDYFLFDSFEGLPPPTSNDGERANRSYWKGWCAADPAKVREVFRSISFPSERLHIVPGWFQDTFPKTPIGPIAMLHIDADWYESVRLCLEYFYSKVAKGGFIFFDDYTAWEGCRKAVDEFLSKNTELELIDKHYIRKP